MTKDTSKVGGIANYSTGLLLFEQPGGYGQIIDKRVVAWDRSYMVPGGMKSFLLRSQEKRVLTVQPQLVFRPTRVIVGVPHGWSENIMIEGLKIGVVEQLYGPLPISLFRQDHDMVFNTCRPEQRIQIYLHNPTSKDVDLRVWLEGRYVEGYKG